MLLSGTISEDCMRIREQSPLIHNITNYVAMSLSANALLAIGASPLMSSEPEEMQDIVSKAEAMTVNIGCLEGRQLEAMRLAAEAAYIQGKPWVLDPAGVGVSTLRLNSCNELIRRFHPGVIRGNASEIMTLAGIQATSRGVDASEESRAALAPAVKLSRESGAVVSVSGPVDYITDGSRIIAIQNGSPLMPQVTAMGCTASAITAAFLAVEKDCLTAAAGAMALMGVTGGKAAAECAGPGSFAVRFIDMLASISPETVAKELRYEERTA